MRHSQIDDQLNQELQIKRQKVLFRAIEESDLEKVERLIQSDHDLIDMADKYGKTPLYKAVEMENFEIVMFLVGADADVKTPIGPKQKMLDEIASDLGNDEIADFIRSRFIEVAPEGYFPRLYQAAKKGDIAPFVEYAEIHAENTKALQIAEYAASLYGLNIPDCKPFAKRLYDATLLSTEVKVELVPHYFRCGIAMGIFTLPVTLSSGHTYDREVLRTWTQTVPGNTFICPRSGQEIQKSELDNGVNKVLRSLAKQFVLGMEKVAMGKGDLPELPTFPNILCCSITKKPFVDPVTLSSGFTFERAALQALVADKTYFQCPRSGKRIHGSEVNNATCVAIQDLSCTIQKQMEFNARVAKSLFGTKASTTNFTGIYSGMYKR